MLTCQEGERQEHGVDDGQHLHAGVALVADAVEDQLDQLLCLEQKSERRLRGLGELGAGEGRLNRGDACDWEVCMCATIKVDMVQSVRVVWCRSVQIYGKVYMPWSSSEQPGLKASRAGCCSCCAPGIRAGATFQGRIISW